MPKLDFLALDRFSSLTQPLRLSIDYQLLAQSLHIDSGTLAFTALHLPLLPATYFPLVPFDPAAPFRVAAYAQNLSLKPVTTLFVDHVDTFFGVCLCGPEMVGELEGVVLETGVLLGDVMGYCGLEDFLTDMHLFHLLLDAGHEVAEDNFGGLFTFVAGPDSPANLAGAGVDGQPAPSILITDWSVCGCSFFSPASSKDASDGRGWVDELAYWVGVQSVDWYDIIDADADAATLFDILRTPTPTSAGWPLDMTSLRDMETQYLTQAGTNRLFIPRPFVASPMYNALGTPWFLDYVHLSSWFFFMALFVLVMWITLVWSIVAKHVESRQPVRETRGFSRAQTGDGITAVLPMTWSITMLMHASTHSVNFDENTTGTLFTLTVIAYQWGWNYYYPRDIIASYWAGPRQLGHGASDTSHSCAQYDFLLGESRRTQASRTTHDFKFASRTGRNVASGALSLFLRPTCGANGYEAALAAIAHPMYAAAHTSPSPTGNHDCRYKNTIHTRLIELLDEAGVGLAAGFGELPRVISSPTAACALVNFSRWTGGANGSTCGSGATGDVSRGFYTRGVLRTDMLRYRDGDAMRTKSTAILSSNRLLLLHTAHMSWLVRGLTPAANGQGAFLLRHLHLRTVANGTTKSTMPEYGSTTPLGRYFLAGSQVGVNSWLFFFNAERYLAAVGERWGGLSFGASTLPQFAEWSHAAGFISARFFTAAADLVIAAETGVLSATPRAAQAVEQQSATSNLRGFMGAQRISQLFIHTAPDGYFLFYFASLLQPEDAGVNFSPAVKELAFRASSYSSYVTHVHLLRLLRTHGGVYTGGGFINLAPFVLFDAGCRAVWSEAGAASRATAQLSGVRPYLDIYTYPLEHSAGRTASGDAWAAGAMPAGQSAVSLGLLFFGNLDAVAARASGALGARVVALANVPVRPSHTPESTEMMLAFRCTTHCAPPHPTHHHLPPATLPTGQRRLPTTVSPLSASSAVAFAAATRSPTTTHLPHSVPAPRVGGVAGFQGDFFTPTHANKTMPAAGLTESLSVVGLLPYDGVDGTKPIRTVSGKLQDPAVFNFRLGDLPTGRVRFSNHLLLNWSLSWSAQTSVYKLPLYKLYRGALERKVGFAFWSAGASPRVGEFQQFLWAGATPPQPTKVPHSSPRVVQIPTAINGVELCGGMTTLDRELAARIRNVLLLLPAPHEEFDVSYVYQHWAPEVTTTRRADHSTRFQTTWAYDAPTTPPHHRPTASNISGFSSTAAGHLDEYSAATAAGLSATIAHPPLPPVCSIIESLRLVEFSPLGTRQTPPHTTLHDASLAGIARWNFVDQQPGFKVSDARAHASGAAQDCLGAHALLALAAREREMLRLARTAAVLSAVAVHPTTAWQVGTTTRLALPAPRQQRSAYEFVRCDVGSMRRLRVTRGVCLPADYPIHIICGSKDVIHSWAVPGLGIKIDCIPGYNSHRRVLFRWRGLYWGQCMEVCGRYHHWMPILIRIVHRDVFLSWCLIYLRMLRSRSLGGQRTHGAAADVVSWLHSTRL